MRSLVESSGSVGKSVLSITSSPVHGSFPVQLKVRPVNWFSSISSYEYLLAPSHHRPCKINRNIAPRTAGVGAGSTTAGEGRGGGEEGVREGGGVSV
jgi:hypothetical protein